MKNPWLILGLVILGCTWLGPLPELARHAFWAHMAMHMSVVAIAAPFIALGTGGTRLDPVRKWPALFPPVPLSIVELVIVWAYHTPALHRSARHGFGGLIAEQLTFLFAGLVLWISVLGGGASLRQERRGAGVAALLLTSMHMTLLGALLALTPRPLYAHETHMMQHLAPLEDQHLGGAIMLAAGGLSYLLGGLWLTTGLIRTAMPTGKEAK
jgi:putative membrane protein